MEGLFRRADTDKDRAIMEGENLCTTHHHPPMLIKRFP